MKNKTLKTILTGILATTVFALGIFSFACAVLAEKTNDIKVEICNNDWSICELLGNSALFENADFLPGDSVERRVRITNKEITPDNPGKNYPVAIEAINVNNPYLGLPFITDKFGDILNFKVEEKIGGEIKYEKTLSEFFDESKKSDEIVIAKLLGNGASKDFIFLVYFDETGSDKYQKSSIKFDIIFGLKGVEGGSIGENPPSGLTIGNENTQTMITNDPIVTEYTAIISWSTSYKSTSQVIYCKEIENCVFDLSKNSGIPPRYGYNYTTEEEDTPANEHGVMDHIMKLTGLLPNTTYEYRTVSHASPPTISREYTFTTLGKNAEAIQANEAANEVSRENQIAFNSPAENISENISEENILSAPAAEIDGGAPSERTAQNSENSGFFEIFSILNKLFIIIIALAMLTGLLYFGYRLKK